MLSKEQISREKVLNNKWLLIKIFQFVGVGESIACNLSLVNHKFKEAAEISKIWDGGCTLDEVRQNRFICCFDREYENPETFTELLEFGVTSLGFIRRELLLFKNLKKISITCSKGITDIPITLMHLANLTELRIVGTSIDKIPTQIGIMVNLTKLDLSNNRIKQIPREINNLTNLIELDLSKNYIKSLPPIHKLKNLEILNLEYNRLENIHESILKLRDLRELYLKRNPPLILSPKFLEDNRVDH